MLEATVHKSLRYFLRYLRQSDQMPLDLDLWPHHLTMARLVARALRLGRSALMQTGCYGYEACYRWGYLMPLGLWPAKTILVMPAAWQSQLLTVDIPCLWNHTSQINKAIATDINALTDDFQGLLILTPDQWLDSHQVGKIPAGIPTVIDGVDDLADWWHAHLTLSFTSADWQHLMAIYPQQREMIRDGKIQLTRLLFQRSPNPYESYMIDLPEQAVLEKIIELIRPAGKSYLPNQLFWQQWQEADQLHWAEIDRQHGHFSLHCAPINLAPILQPLWSKQPIVLIGNGLEVDAKAPIYRQEMGLDDLTCVKFTPDRERDLMQLYVPNHLPLPNTPEFQKSLLKEIFYLLTANITQTKAIPNYDFTVILVGDVPLKAQIASVLAAQFGSRVQLETTQLEPNSILVTDWQFWRQEQANLPNPSLLIIPTLPIPSLENPLVAGRVAYHKANGQDWFRLYLLPMALRQLQRAIAPVRGYSQGRENPGILALLDSRVIYRSYGQEILAAVSPFARINRF